MPIYAYRINRASRFIFTFTIDESGEKNNVEQGHIEQIKDDSANTDNKTKTGFAEGEQINLRLWKKNKGISVDLEAIFKNGETEAFYFSETIDKIISFRSPLNTNLTSTKYHGFQIYPNPAIEFFNIEIPEKEKSEKIIEICNTNGSVIHKCNFNQNQISFSTELFPSGIYFIKLYSGKTSFSKKIIIY